MPGSERAVMVGLTEARNARDERTVRNMADFEPVDGGVDTKESRAPSAAAIADGLGVSRFDVRSISDACGEG